jgi:hypothetical protein
MKTYHIQTQKDDVLLSIDQQEETLMIPVQGKWYTDGRSPLLPLFSEYAGLAPKVILDLSKLDYRWLDGILRCVVTEYWQTSSQVMVITPSDHPRWVDLLIFCYHNSSVPTGAHPGALSIQCGDYVWHHGEELDSDFSSLLTKLSR